MPPKVDIGITCRDQQSHHWWAPIMGELVAYARHNVVDFGRVLPVGSAMTDFNANEIVRRFLEHDSDWLWMIEDDTVPPKKALAALLSHGHPFAAGLYYSGNQPYNPIAFFRNTAEDYAADNTHTIGTYRPVKGWDRGEIFEIDSVGMGCTLIHRSVFEKIKAEHVLKMSITTAEVYPVHKDDWIDTPLPDEYKHGKVYGGALIVRLVDCPPGDTRAWPFYFFNRGRTQDHYFAELAERVGFKPLLDTSVECQHWKQKAITGGHFRQFADAYIEAARVEESIDEDS